MYNFKVFYKIFNISKTIRNELNGNIYKKYLNKVIDSRIFYIDISFQNVSAMELKFIIFYINIRF